MFSCERRKTNNRGSSAGSHQSTANEDTSSFAFRAAGRTNFAVPRSPGCHVNRYLWSLLLSTRDARYTFYLLIEPADPREIANGPIHLRRAAALIRPAIVFLTINGGVRRWFIDDTQRPRKTPLPRKVHIPRSDSTRRASPWRPASSYRARIEAFTLFRRADKRQLASARDVHLHRRRFIAEPFSYREKPSRR